MGASSPRACPTGAAIRVSPEEFLKIQTEELKLPKGWRIGEEMLKPMDDAGAA